MEGDIDKIDKLVLMTSLQASRQTHGQTEWRHRNRQTERQTDGRTDGQTDRWMDTGRQMNRWAENTSMQVRSLLRQYSPCQTDGQTWAQMHK